MNKKIQFIALFIILILNLYSDPPNWEVIPGTQYSMLLRAHINHNNELFEGEGNNMTAAFASIDEEEECRSVGAWIEAHPPYYEEGFWQFGIVSNQTEGEVISFKIYDEEADSIHNCIQIIIFESAFIAGSGIHTIHHCLRRARNLCWPPANSHCPVPVFQSSSSYILAYACYSIFYLNLYSEILRL